MSGVTQQVKKIIGKDEGSTAVKNIVEPTVKAQAQKSASAEAAEDAAARRRARRGGRALLSEARLSPEQGVGQQTLGAGPMA